MIENTSKNWFTTLKRLLGFEAPVPPPPPPPTKLDLVAKQYQATAPGNKVAFLATKEQEARQGVENELQKLKGVQLQSVSVDTANYQAASRALEWVEVLHFIFTERNALEQLSEEKTQESREAVFTTLLSVFKTLAVPGKTFTKELENYIQKFEQSLLLTEARGEYEFLQSENKAWVKLPLLQFLPSTHFDRKVPTTELNKIFYTLPQAKILDIETTIPKTKVSLIDVEQYIANKQVVPFRTTDPEYWYLYIA